MQRPIALVVVLLLAGALLGGAWWEFQRSVKSPPPTLSFTGREPGRSPAAAGFSITNGGLAPDYLQYVEVQVREGNAWVTSEQKGIQMAQVSTNGTLDLEMTPVLESRQQRKLIYDWPEAKTWRLCVGYAKEGGNFKGAKAKVKTALIIRSPLPVAQRVWIGSEQVFSEEISK